MTTEIKRCTCHNEFQDKKYGPYFRVANKRLNGKFRCTVCSKDL